MRVTFLSNGHGEDAIGALLAREFHAQCPTLALRAFPTVDEGGAYERAGVPVLGPRRVMPSGGFLFHSAELFLADLRAGFLPMTLQQLRSLRQLDTDMLIVIGDVVALAMSALVRSPARYYVQPLVSVHHATPAAHRPNRLFMERFTGIERALIRRLVKHTYVRDAPTATHLHALGLRQVSSLGNPMLAAHDPHARLPELGLRRPVVGMLPGTRRHAAASLTVMLQALASWPQAHGVVAWAGGMLPPLEVAGWCPQDAPEVPGLLLALGRGAQRVYVLEGCFAAVLNEADLVLGTAGTANEQAAALGKPVLAFPMPPVYTPAFLANQQRLLAEALTVCPAEPAQLAAALQALWSDPRARDRAAAAGRERMGPPGGAAAIVTDILRRAGLVGSEVKNAGKPPSGGLEPPNPT